MFTMSIKSNNQHLEGMLLKELDHLTCFAMWGNSMGISAGDERGRGKDE